MPPFAHETDKSLSEFTTLGIGGPARLFAIAENVAMMREMIQWCSQSGTPFFILGKGSNVLFDDRGYNGLVILNKIDSLLEDHHSFTVGSAFSFARLALLSTKKGLSGLEFAAGIPATVGGAIYMNAGANGQETKDCLREVGYITEKGEEKVLMSSEIEFRYRFSSFQQWRGAITYGRFELKASEGAKKRQDEIVSYRLKTQPYKEHSAGCIFQNPPNGSAGRLIEESGLKGKRIGGAVVSEMHANFLLNREQATAADILALIDFVKEEVYRKSGIVLHEEVRFIPYV